MSDFILGCFDLILSLCSSVENVCVFVPTFCFFFCFSFAVFIRLFRSR